MPDDLGLKLLELTSGGNALSLNELGTFPRFALNEDLTALGGNGFLTLSDGYVTMNGNQRVLLAERLIHGGVDAKKVSRFLAWQEFEDFSEDILSENDFSTRKHLVFKSTAGRREIDILAWNDTFTLAVDCKHWLRGLSSGRMKDAAKAQVERATALAGRPELLQRLKLPNLDGRTIMPVILTLGELRDRVLNGVPIVSVSRLLSFIYGVSPIDATVSRIRVQDSSSQTRLA